MKHRGLFIACRLFVRPWISRLRPIRLIQALTYSLDFLFGFFARFGFSSIKINDHLQADTIIHSRLGERPVLLYLHGGAFCLHLPNGYRSLSRKLAKICEIDLVMPEYRLAPQHKFPAGLDDCVTAYEYLLKSGVQSDNIVIIGDSAGGNLTLATISEILRKDLPMPKCAVTMSPVVDARAETESFSKNIATEFYFSQQTIKAVRKYYLSENDDIHDPRISPINADLSKFPPVLIHACHSEVLEDDAETMNRAINDAGGQSRLRMWHDLPHVFHMIPTLDETEEAITDIGNFVRSHLHS